MRQAAMVGKVCLALLFAVSFGFGQTSAGTKAKSTAGKKTSSVSSRLAGMEKALEAQQQQIQQLQDQLKGRDSQVQQLQQQLTETQSSITQAQQAAQTAQAEAAKSAPAEQLDAVKKDVTDLQNTATSYALNLQETQKQTRAMLESPTSLHFKGVTLTPGGFFAAETVWRNRGLTSDVNTPFNNVNLPFAEPNRISEFYGSGRQSRISMLVEGKLSDELRYGGYYEADFLSAGVTSNNNQSNSYTFRQRQFWAQAAYKSWTFTGGQMWSLVTETKKGMDNRSEALPMTIDAQYTAGFSWARQYGFRVVDQLNKYAWLGFSIENPQTTFAARNNAGNFVIGSLGNSGGLYNAFNGNYSLNATPDFVAKAAFEPGFGHYEIFGVFSRFRDRVYPCAEVFPGEQAFCTVNGVPGTAGTEGASNISRNGGGGGANARITLFKQLDIGAHGLVGNGIGRYGTTGLPDATVNADGTLHLLRSYQALGTIEWHKPKFDIYLNGGGEYVARHFSTDPIQKKDVGYGAPSYDTVDCYKEPLPAGGTGFGFGNQSKCQADTRNILEGTAGFWYKIYNGPKGRLQLGPQYSYVVRNTWRGTGGTPHGIDNMIFTSFRYYLP
jgi:hypothetical protein